MRPKLKKVYLESSRSRKWHFDWKKSVLALALSCRIRSGIQDSWIPASAGMTDKIVLTRPETTGLAACWSMMANAFLD
jgi:hypothetical protein